jgi:hypothetical protein
MSTLKYRYFPGTTRTNSVVAEYATTVADRCPGNVFSVAHERLLVDASFIEKFLLKPQIRSCHREGVGRSQRCKNRVKNTPGKGSVLEYFVQ